MNIKQMTRPHMLDQPHAHFNGWLRSYCYKTLHPLTDCTVPTIGIALFDAVLSLLALLLAQRQIRQHHKIDTDQMFKWRLLLVVLITVPSAFLKDDD